MLDSAEDLQGRRSSSSRGISFSTLSFARTANFELIEGSMRRQTWITFPLTAGAVALAYYATTLKSASSTSTYAHKVNQLSFLFALFSLTSFLPIDPRFLLPRLSSCSSLTRMVDARVACTDNTGDSASTSFESVASHHSRSQLDRDRRESPSLASVSLKTSIEFRKRSQYVQVRLGMTKYGATGKTFVYGYWGYVPTAATLIRDLY